LQLLGENNGAVFIRRDDGKRFYRLERSR